jgi:hypothetical protein
MTAVIDFIRRAFGAVPGPRGPSRSRTEPRSALQVMQCALHIRGRGQRYVPLIAALALGGLGVVATTPALAAEHWAAHGAFGLAPADPQPLSDPASLAVNQSTGDVYVVDEGNSHVEYFTATGGYLGEFDGSATPAKSLSSPEALAVDSDPTSPSFGDVYVADQGHHVVDKFSATGSYLGQITGTCPAVGTCAAKSVIPFLEIYGVAVDQDGVVWVESGETEHVHPAIDSFSDGQPNTFLASRTSLVEGIAQAGLAVDSEDNVYVALEGARYVAKLNSVGELVGEREIGGLREIAGLTVDPAGNDLFLDDGSSVSVFSSAATFSETFGGGLLNGAGSVAVDPTAGTSGYAYLAEPSANEVLVLEHSETSEEPPPAPTTDPATEVNATTMTLNGELNPEGGVGYDFSYNAGAESTCNGPGSTSTPLDNGGANLTGSTTESVSATVTGLEPEIQYTYCLIAVKFGGTPGPQKTVETTAGRPAVISQSASNIEEARARFAATLNPDHSKQETTYLFEYSTEGSTETNTLTGTIQTIAGRGSIPAEVYGPEEIASEIATLPSVEDTYYYRVVATNEAGTTTGSVQAYTKTPALSPSNIANLTTESVTLEAAVYPNFQSTNYGFEYARTLTALEEGHGTLVSGAAELGANEEETPPTPVAVNVTGLERNTLYYYRLVAENASTRNTANPGKGAPVTGTPGHFITESLPFVATGEAQGITRSSAALTGEVTPIDQPTTYYFQYVSEAAYNTALAGHAADPYAEGETSSPIGLETSPEPQVIGPVAADGLLPETTYHYRLDAKNEFGVTYGEDHTFTTGTRILPSAATGAATAVTSTTAMIAGTVTTNGLSTDYAFEVATEPGAQPGSYGPLTGQGHVGGAATEPVTAALTGLTPGATYYYLLGASNVDGIVYGQPESFTTSGLPYLLAAPITTIGVPTPATALGQEPHTTINTGPPHLTNKQKLANALKVCRRDKKKSKRTKCEKAAKKKYEPAKKTRRKKT